MRLKVGDIARRCGLTVRTLHHYDQVGLLRPSARSDAGYRLYGRDDLARLYRIQALRALGLPLARIGALLDRPQGALPTVIDQQVQAIDRQIAQQTALRTRLLRLREQVTAGDAPAAADWLTTLELMTVYDKHFSNEEQARLPIDPARGALSEPWRALADEAEALKAAQVPPADGRAQALAVRWMRRLEVDMASDPALMLRLDAMHRDEPAVAEALGLPVDVVDYVKAAYAENRLAIYARHLSAADIAYMRPRYAAQMAQWPALMAGLRDSIEAGHAATSEPARALATRYLAMMRAMAGDDPATHRRLQQAHATDPDLRDGPWADPVLIAYLREAVLALQGGR